MKHLYTYLPRENTASTEGILSTRLAPKGWEKYIERSGKHTKEEVLAWLDSLVPGFKRSNAISVFTEPIPDNAHPDMVAFRDAKALYAIPEYKELIRLGVAKALRRIRTGNRRGTDSTSYPKYRKIDWEHIEPGKFLFSNVPHYLLELDKGRVPAKYVEKQASAKAPYGYRYNPKTKKFDGAPKFTGWRGPIKLHNGKVMTEFSTTVDGREIPMIVPTTTDDDIKQIQANIKNGTPIPQHIFDKAINFARQRVKAGKDPFYNGDKEDQTLVKPYTPAN